MTQAFDKNDCYRKKASVLNLFSKISVGGLVMLCTKRKPNLKCNRLEIEREQSHIF